MIIVVVVIIIIIIIVIIIVKIIRKINLPHPFLQWLFVQLFEIW